MRAIKLGLLIVSVASMAMVPARRAAPQAKPATSPQALRQKLERFADAWNRHDVYALMSMMTTDCVFEAVGRPPG